MSAYRAVTCRSRQSRDRNDVRDQNIPTSDVIGPEVTWKRLWRPISQVLGTFELLKGFNSPEVAVTCPEMTSRDWK